jgi:hypothetical protein
MVVYLDARFDFSRLGFHGTTSICDKESDKVVEIVIKMRSVEAHGK